MSGSSGLRDDENVTGSPDGSVTIVGSEGIESLQENGQLVVRTGVGGEQRDYDIKSESITNDTDVLLASPDSVGTTRELSGGLESDQGNPFSLKVQWQADDDTVLYTQDYAADTAFQIDAITTKSDNVKVVATDESGSGDSNTITGTLNFH